MRSSIRGRPLCFLAVLLCGLFSLGPAPMVVAQPNEAANAAESQPVYLIIRSDDAGMSHSVNMALERLIKTGLPVSVSVMFPTPWYQEAVEILKRNPAVAVGIHLTLNSEWKNYRWGPVAGRSAVPTLVDADGYFFPSSEALYRNQPDPAHVETELRAQIERALRSGLRIDYVDYHMGTAVQNREFREIVEKLAREFGLAMSGYFGEARHAAQYPAPPPEKTDSLLAVVARLKPGLNLLITHVGVDGPELGALVDMNTSGSLPDMSKHRQGELEALTSQRFRQALQERNVQLLTYRQLVEMQGVQAMSRPGQ